MAKINLDFMHSELNRVSDWVRFADRKVAFLAVYYSAVISYILVQKDQFIETISVYSDNCLWLSHLIAFSVIGLLFIGIVYLVLAIFPRTKNHYTNKSLFYFGNIAGMKLIDFTKNFEKLSEADAKKQLTEQIYTNSVIASKKMECIKSSSKLLLVSLLILAIMHVYK